MYTHTRSCVVWLDLVLGLAEVVCFFVTLEFLVLGTVEVVYSDTPHVLHTAFRESIRVRS